MNLIHVIVIGLRRFYIHINKVKLVYVNPWLERKYYIYIDKEI